MKKILITLTIALGGVAAVQAQNDSTGVQPNHTAMQPSATEQSNTTTSPSNTTPQPSMVVQPQYLYREENRVTVKPDRLPAALRQTLQSDQYKGWENSTIYQDGETKDYYMNIGNGNAVRTYRFDLNGKAVNDKAIGNKAIKTP